MSYFAKRLRYGAHYGEESGSFMALIEIAKKKGGAPVMFVLYLHDSWQNGTKMLKVKVNTAEEALELLAVG